MKKLFTLVAAAMIAVGVNAQKISWGIEDVALAGALNGKTITNGLVGLTVTDTGSKVAIDKNTARFGTADSYEKFEARLKSGGKSSSKNCLALSVPSDGTLKICARTGSSSAEDRTVVLTQNATVLFNQILLDANFIEVDEEGAEGIVAVKVYPVYSIPVSAGTIDITYPVGSINFYCFEFVSENGISTILTPEVKENAPIYNLAGQQVSKDFKGVCIQNGKKFINK